MTSEDRPGDNPEVELFNDMLEFFLYAANGNAQIAALRGPIDVPTIFHTFAGLFPEGTFAAVSNRNGVDKIALYGNILGLSIPGRVLAVEDLDRPSLRRAHERLLSLNGLPSIVLAIGETQATQEEAIYIATARGIIPGTGLAEIQEAVRRRTFE